MVEFYRPTTLDEALKIRAEHGATPLAGGTDLLVRYRSWAGTLPKLEKPVLYLGRVVELGGISPAGISPGVDGAAGPHLRIGAAVTYSELLEHPQIHHILKQAIRELSAPGLRNIATLAGNICNASPAADAVCALYVLNARLELTRWNGSAGGGELRATQRYLAIQDFIRGPGKTELQAEELLTAVYLPAFELPISSYHKVGTRRANALSKLSFCGVAKLENGVVAAVAMAVGAVAPVVLRSAEIEASIVGAGRAELEAQMGGILAAYDKLISPIDDQRSSAAYRRSTAKGLVERFLREEIWETA